MDAGSRPKGVTIIATLFLVLGLYLVVSPPRGSGRADAQERSLNTYLLTDLLVSYPYASTFAEGDEGRLAGVSFIPRWSGPNYPGRAECHLILRAADGVIVGETDISVSVPEPHRTRTPWTPVPVSGSPAFAEGSCSEAIYEPGQGYSFEFLGATRADDAVSGNAIPDSVLKFRTSWIGSDHPGLRRCEFTVFIRGGEALNVGPYNVSVGQPVYDGFDTSVPQTDPSTITGATASCLSL